MSADPDKIDHIVQEVKVPLRQLLEKDATYMTYLAPYNPKKKTHLMQFRATPHATMKKSPAELLFGRKFVTKLPDLTTNPARGRRDIEETREEDRRAKDKMKEYKDDSREVKEHSIKAGDMVIAKRKVTKYDSLYDPKPYKVVATYGTQIKGEREDGKKKTRDSQNWKNMEVNKKTSYAEVVRSSRYQEEADIRAGTREETGAGGQGREGEGGRQVQEGGQGGNPGEAEEGAGGDHAGHLGQKGPEDQAAQEFLPGGGQGEGGEARKRQEGPVETIVHPDRFDKFV